PAVPPPGPGREKAAARRRGQADLYPDPSGYLSQAPAPVQRQSQGRHQVLPRARPEQVNHSPSPLFFVMHAARLPTDPRRRLACTKNPAVTRFEPFPESSFYVRPFLVIFFNDGETCGHGVGLHGTCHYFPSWG